MDTPVTIMRAAARAMPHRPHSPKATKYCMASWPEAKPAPTTTPINAMEIPIARLIMRGETLLLTLAGPGFGNARARIDGRFITCVYLIESHFTRHFTAEIASL